LIWYACKEWSENVAYYKEVVDPDKWDARWVALWEKRTKILVKTYEIELKPL
jgi:hypothetical protein